MDNLDFYKGKKVLITGHTGFKGSWLCVLLKYMGAEICGYSHMEYELYKKAEIDNINISNIADICDNEKLMKVVDAFEPEIIFHLAAQPLVIDSYKDPIKTYNTNVMGTVNILEAARLCKSVKCLVNITTDKVYKNNEWHWGYREEDKLCGRDPYSNSKSCSELVTYSYSKSFFKGTDKRIASARAGNVIGGGDFANNRIVPDCYKAVKKNQKIIVRNKASVRPWQHVLEPLWGYLTLAEILYKGMIDELSFNFGPNDYDCVSVEILASLFCKYWGEDAEWVYKPTEGAVHEAAFLKLDSSLALNLLKWSPTWNVEIAVEKTVEWYKRYISGEQAYELMLSQAKEFLQETGEKKIK